MLLYDMICQLLLLLYTGDTATWVACTALCVRVSCRVSFSLRPSTPSRLALHSADLFHSFQPLIEIDSVL